MKVKGLMISFFAFFLFLFSPAFAQVPVNAVNANIPLKQVVDQAMVAIGKSLRQNSIPKELTIAVLPLRCQNPNTISGENNDYFVGRMTNLLVDSGYRGVVSKEDKVWTDLAVQIGWEEQKNDILDASSVTILGRQMAAQVLIYGSISQLMDYGPYLAAEITLYAVNLKTAEHCWGGTFVGRAYKGKDIQGIVALDTDIRGLFAQVFHDAEAEMNTPTVQEKLGTIRSAAILPVIGDIDQYATQMAEGLMSKQHLILARNISVPTLDMACRAFGHDGHPIADAILQVTLRDISETYEPEVVGHLSGSDGRAYGVSRKWTKRVEFNFSLIRATDKTVLWSSNIAAEKDGVETRQATEEEVRRIIQGEENHFLYVLKHPFSSEGSAIYKAIAIILIAVIAIVVILSFVKGILMMINRR